MTKDFSVIGSWSLSPLNNKGEQSHLDYKIIFVDILLYPSFDSLESMLRHS